MFRETRAETEEQKDGKVKGSSATADAEPDCAALLWESVGGGCAAEMARKFSWGWVVGEKSSLSFGAIKNQSAARAKRMLATWELTKREGAAASQSRLDQSHAKGDMAQDSCPDGQQAAICTVQ